MDENNKVNILLVDDQPGKLLSFEVMLADLGENLLPASSAKQAFEHLLKNDIALILIDVCMPEQDGFDLAAMIREHPRFREIAIIFVSAVNLTPTDFMKGYSAGAVDYVPVPVVPEVLRAKVKVFAELHRKTRQLERFNQELEQRVAARTAELEASTAELRASEQRRSMALAAGSMGAWDYDAANEKWIWDEGQCRIFGVAPNFEATPASVLPRVNADDWARLIANLDRVTPSSNTIDAEMRIYRPDGEERWCLGTAAATFDGTGKLVQVSGVTFDITERKQDEARQLLLTREVDHRARNVLTVVQSIVRLTRAHTQKEYVNAVEGRIQALSKAHELLAQSRWVGADVTRLVEDELAPYRGNDANRIKITGPAVLLPPDRAQALALALHELATNAAKYGALSMPSGRVDVHWENDNGKLMLQWRENGGPPVERPTTNGFGTKIVNASVGRNGGRAMFDWRRDGLSCTLLLVPDAPEAPRSADAAPVTDVQQSEGTILLVEDEALVGMMMREFLLDMGYAVVGPVATLIDALKAADHGDLIAAVLDVNLKGERVYPLAEKLTALSIPFLFVTGYGSDHVSPQFQRAPILQKPLMRETLETVVRKMTNRTLAAAQ